MVPPTPLHTSRVLMEDRELWDDVKVRYCNVFVTLPPCVEYTMAMVLGRLARDRGSSGVLLEQPLDGAKAACCHGLTSAVFLCAGGDDQRLGHHACGLRPGLDQRLGHLQQPAAQ